MSEVLKRDSFAAYGNGDPHREDGDPHREHGDPIDDSDGQN
jgi:hypothetical protein